VDRELGLMVIKPSGVPYSQMKPEHMVVVSVTDGKVVDGKLKPSSDTPTHLVLYRKFTGIGGVVHTHSLFATAWAQACEPLLAYGTTQADYWYGDVPCTRKLKEEEIKTDYEANTGEVIVNTFKKLKYDPLQHPAVLVASHGPFTWGKDVHDAVHNASVLEFIARLNSETLRINPKVKPMQSELLDKHFLRKHGPGAYYGQK
jgi:L-ribulose-5-phosphate 4-epimerase